MCVVGGMGGGDSSCLLFTVDSSATAVKVRELLWTSCMLGDLLHESQHTRIYAAGSSLASDPYWRQSLKLLVRAQTILLKMIMCKQPLFPSQPLPLLLLAHANKKLNHDLSFMTFLSVSP